MKGGLKMKYVRVVGLVGAMLCSTVAFASNVKTDYDRSFDFARLRTFTFRPWTKGALENGLVDSRIREALRRDLESKGFRYQPDGPADFVVVFYAHQREKAETDVVGYGMPYRWRWGWGPAFWTRYYTEGSVLVDFVDPVSNQLVWRGRVTDTVSGLDQSQKQINKGVDQLVKHFEKDVRRSEKREA
jgi:Domain of unknown function (DUF4136)